MKPTTCRIGLNFMVSALVFSAILTLPAMAGPNDFFGSSGTPTVGADDSKSPSGSAASSASGSPSEATPTPARSATSDFTADEKQMQKHYKERVKHAQELIARADKMMKDKNSKMFKRGQVLKAIAEKDLENLKSNNPIPDAHKKLEDKP